MSDSVWELDGPDWEPIETRIDRLLCAFRYVPITQQTLLRIRLRLQEFCIPVTRVEGALTEENEEVIRITIDDGTWIQWP
jgi:hypothetical protein